MVALGKNGLIDGGTGNDKLIIAGENNSAHGGEGKDEIAMITKGYGYGGTGDDAFLMKEAASGSVISGGDGTDSMFVPAKLTDDWTIETAPSGTEGEFTFTSGDVEYTFNGIENVHFEDGRTMTYDGTGWSVSTAPTPEAPLTTRPDFSFPDRVPEGELEAEQTVSISLADSGDS